MAWEAIQQKLIEYYANKWQEEYASRLDLDYEELKNNISDVNTENNQEEYIKAVCMSQEIDITTVQELLFYFLLSKQELQEISLFDYLEQFYDKVRVIKETITSENIKNKLKTKQKRKIRKYSITDVDLMTGTEFEEFISLLFNKMGYSSKVTQKSGDQGIDVIATRNGTKIGIQAKCYSGAVGNTAVQEVIAGKMFYKCDKALVVTNNYFTPTAIELAQSSDIILWNRDLLKEKILEFM